MSSLLSIATSECVLFQSFNGSNSNGAAAPKSNRFLKTKAIIGMSWSCTSTELIALLEDGELIFLDPTLPSSNLLFSMSMASFPSIASQKGSTWKCFATSLKNPLIYVGTCDGTLLVINYKTQTLVDSFKICCPTPIVRLACNCDESCIVLISSKSEAFIFSSMSRHAAPLPCLSNLDQGITALEFSYLKKNMLTFGLESGECGLVDTASQSLFTFSKGHDAPTKGVAFSPFNRYLSCSCGMDQKIILYDVEKKKLVKVIQTAFPLCSISFKDDGVTLAVGSVGGRVLIFDLRKGSEPIHNFQASAAIESIDYLKFSASKPGKSLMTNVGSIISSLPRAKLSDQPTEAKTDLAPKSSSTSSSILDVFSPVVSSKTLNNPETTNQENGPPSNNQSSSLSSLFSPAQVTRNKDNKDNSVPLHANFSPPDSTATALSRSNSRLNTPPSSTLVPAAVAQNSSIQSGVEKLFAKLTGSVEGHCMEKTSPTISTLKSSKSVTVAEKVTQNDDENMNVEKAKSTTVQSPSSIRSTPDRGLTTAIHNNLNGSTQKRMLMKKGHVAITNNASDCMASSDTVVSLDSTMAAVSTKNHSQSSPPNQTPLDPKPTSATEAKPMMARKVVSIPTTSTPEGMQAILDFQQQLIQESMVKMQNMHLDMIHQFHLQKVEMEELFERYCPSAALLEENHRLREELDMLRFKLMSRSD